MIFELCGKLHSEKSKCIIIKQHQRIKIYPLFIKSEDYDLRVLNKCIKGIFEYIVVTKCNNIIIYKGGEVTP